MARFARRRTFKKRTVNRRSFKRRGPVRRGASKRVTRVSKKQFATATGTFEGPDLGPNTIINYNVNLSNVDRLVTIAQMYRYYRIVKVEYRYESDFTMAQQGGSGAAGVGLLDQQRMPNMYTVMDRNGNYPYTTLSQLEELGLKGSKFRGVRKVAYVPNILIATNLIAGIGPGSAETAQAMTSTPKKMQWLPTADPVKALGSSTNFWSNIPHYGHTVFFDQQDAAGNRLGRQTCTITAQFKDPAYPQPPAA